MGAGTNCCRATELSKPAISNAALTEMQWLEPSLDAAVEGLRPTG
jgi:hypothetical protein